MFEFRTAQRQALIQILTAIKEGKTDIFVQAPTGTGKSLIALELAKIVYERKGWKSFILTSEKLLQAQYETDCDQKYDLRYESSVSISGVDNYTCHVNEEKFSLGHCKLMGLSNRQALALPCAAQCDYLQRWRRAQESPHVIFNYAYYLLQMNYVYAMKMGQAAPFQPRQLIICDEAHNLPDVVEGHFACFIDQSMPFKIRECQALLARAGIITPFDSLSMSYYSKLVENALRIPLSDTHKQYKSLCSLYSILYDARETVNTSKKILAGKFNIALPEGNDEAAYIKASQLALDKVPEAVVKFFKMADDFKDFTCKLEDYVKIIGEHGVHNMVVESPSPTKRTFHNLSDGMLYKNHLKPFSEVRVYMSATLQPHNLIDRWSLDPERVAVITLNSGWDPSNSPVRLCKTANFRHDNGDEATLAAVEKIDEILAQHPGERGIIHTTTYKITESVLAATKQRSRLIEYQGTREKMTLLRDIRDLPDDAVLIGPSLTQGVDLPDDLARFNIIVKLSYPDVSSRLWSARLALKKGVYLAETANRLEQSSGRSTRHADDTSVTYILDSRADKFIFSPQTGKYLSQEFVSRVIAAES
jgi:Rad3-related DNA helicase